MLVQRGNDEVIQEHRQQPGRRIHRGYAVGQPRRGRRLCDLRRPASEHSAYLYLKLLAKASDTVRQRLEAANPEQAAQVPTAVKEATRRARSASTALTQNTAIAHALVKSLYEDGRLDAFQVASFARAGKFNEANASTAALTSVPVAMPRT